MVHLARTKFFWKILKIILSYLLTPLIVQNLKKILPVDPVMRMRNFFPKCEFFSENLLMSLVSFIHAYLHAENRSQILMHW